MSQYIFYPATHSPALRAAGEALMRRGYGVVSRPCESITHLLLPVPSLEADGTIKGGGELRELLELLPENVTVVGGKLPRELGKNTVDLLLDQDYLCANAYLTAHCAVRLAMVHLPITLRGCRVLIIGWGRIGKCLTRLLRALEADLTVAARSPTDRAMAGALGYRAAPLEELLPAIDRFQLIINTVPAPILTEEHCAECRQSCLLLDLASEKGIVCDRAIWARGLPGRDVPEASGALIARAAIRSLSRKDAS